MRESENNKPAAQGAVGELRTEASNLITMRDLIGERTISAKFKHVYRNFSFYFAITGSMINAIELQHQK